MPDFDRFCEEQRDKVFDYLKENIKMEWLT